MVLKAFGLTRPIPGGFFCRSNASAAEEDLKRSRSTKQLLLAMKLTAVFLLLACLTAGAKGFSQITLSEKNAPLQKIFKAIQKQSGYDFFYTYEVIEKAGNTTVNLYRMPLEKAIEEVLKDKPLTYIITGKTVVIKEKTTPSFSIPGISEQAAAASKISGLVKDEKGMPLDGASVVARSSGKGVSTDAKGRFTIEADIGDILDVSRVGYKTTVVIISSNAFLEISMPQEITAATEVIVVGYGTQKKTNVTGCRALCRICRSPILQVSRGHPQASI